MCCLGWRGEFGLAGDGVAFMTALEDVVAQTIKPLADQYRRRARGSAVRPWVSAGVWAAGFIIGRVAGLSAEVMEELAREKAMRIRIPVEYDGPPPRELP